MKTLEQWNALEGLYVDIEEIAKEHLFGLDKVLIPMGFTMDEILSYTSTNLLIHDCYDESALRNYGDYRLHFRGYEWVQDYDDYGRPLYYTYNREKLPKGRDVARYYTALRVDRLNYWALQIEKLLKGILLNMNNDERLAEFINAIDMGKVYLYNNNVNNVLYGNITWDKLDNKFNEFARKDILFTIKDKVTKTNFFCGYNDKTGILGNRVNAHVDLKKLLKYVRKANKNT